METKNDIPNTNHKYRKKPQEKEKNGNITQIMEEMKQKLRK